MLKLRGTLSLATYLVVGSCSLPAAPQAKEAPVVKLTGTFGSISIDTHAGLLTDLKLRNPDGSLPSRALTSGAIGTSVVSSDGAQYESQDGSPSDVTVQRDDRGVVKSVELKGISLRRSQMLSPVVVGSADSVLFSRDGKWAYVTDFAEGSVTPFNPVTGKASEPIRVGGFPTGIVEAPNGNLFVSCYSRIPPNAEPVVPPNAPQAQGQLVQLDPSSRSVIATIPVGANPEFPAITPDGKTILVPNYGEDSVTVVETSTARVRTTIKVGPGPVTVVVSPDGKSAYVTNLGSWNLLSIDIPPPGSDTVTPIDLESMTARDPITVGQGPFGVAVTPDGKNIVVSLSRAHCLAIIDRATGTVTKRIDLRVYSTGGFPSGLVLSPDGSTAYVAVASLTSISAARSVVPVNLKWGEKLTPLPRSPRTTFAGSRRYLPPGLFPNGVALSPDGKLLLAVDWLGGTVSRYDLNPPRTFAPLTEDWTVSTTADGQLQWQITQHWQQAFSGIDQSEPAIPFTFGVTDTLWYEPDRILTLNSDPLHKDAAASNAFSQTLADAPTWAIYKLWSPYHFQSDLKLNIDGGYLTRFVSSSSTAARAGASFDSSGSFRVSAGTKRRLTLRISASNKYHTGYQLDVDVPDRAMLRSLADLYQSVLNAGAVADQKAYWFGNGVSGVLTAYQALDDGAAFNVGVPAGSPTSAHDYSMQSAMRGYLEAILESIDEKGRLHFGFSGWTGAYQDAMLMALVGLYQYTIHTGDLTLFRSKEPAVDRILQFWISRIGPNGLVLSRKQDGNYHDVGIAFGSTYYFTYINVLVYESLVNVADLEHALSESATGERASTERASALAASYANTAAKLKDAINQVLWSPDSPHGPMYADWINGDTGHKVYYFMGDSQYAAITFGIANQEQAKAILATADARLKELTANYGYKGTGTLTVLWALEPDMINYRRWPFTVYENGGMLLYETYYEVVARAVAGDPDGAYRRLADFAQAFDKTSWWGDNGASINGSMEGGSGEPYLQDMVIVPTSLVQGILGINGTWDRLNVRPALPSGWLEAQASVIYRGQSYCIKIHGENIERFPHTCSHETSK